MGCHLSSLLLLKYPTCSFKKYIYLFDCNRFGGFPGGSQGKECTYKAGDLNSIPGLGRSLGEGNGNSFQYSCLENSMDSIGSWQATVNGVTKSQTQLNDYHQALLAGCELLLAAYVIQVSDQGSNSAAPSPPALGAWNLHHWTTREVPLLYILTSSVFNKCYTLIFLLDSVLGTRISSGNKTFLFLGHLYSKRRDRKEVNK